MRTEPGSGLTVSGDLPSMSDGSPEAVLRGQLGLGSFAPPFEASFALELPAPCSTTPGLIPPTALLPVVGGTIREDTCGSGAFGAPRGSGLNHGVDIVGNLGDGIAAVYDGTVVAVQTGCVADLVLLAGQPRLRRRLRQLRGPRALDRRARQRALLQRLRAARRGLRLRSATRCWPAR